MDDQTIAAQTSSELRPGEVFAGRYRIIDVLGQGDRKCTYLAFDQNIPRMVALGLVRPDADPTAARREVEHLAQAGGHDFIVTLHEQGTSAGVQYLVYEYMSGGTLRDYLASRRGDPLPVEEAMKFGRQLSRALSHVHERGIIHRDIAPANIWLDERHEAHLGDFDSAVKRDGKEAGPPLSPTAKAYMSPEFAAGERADERSDLYSLGAVLYEAVTGRPPERTSRGVMPPRRLRPEMPADFNATICKLLSESPSDRPASAAELLKALKATAAKPPTSAYALAEALPFPLASILWRYHAEVDPRLRVNYLLAYFEALAQFTATVLLSAFSADHKYFDAHRSSWFGSGPDGAYGLDFKVASFGMWVDVNNRLAKHTRRLISEGQAGADKCRGFFAAQDQELIDVLTSRSLADVIEAACEARNRQAHGGAISAAEAQRRVAELDDLLATIQSPLAEAFETWLLLRPGPSTYKGGIHNYTVDVLMGTHHPFRKAQIRLTHPLEADRLYLLHGDNQRALELVPLLRVGPTPTTEEDACHFYSRTLPDGLVRWVSHHFEPEPELDVPGDDVLEFLKALTPLVGTQLEENAP